MFLFDWNGVLEIHHREQTAKSRERKGACILEAIVCDAMCTQDRHQFRFHAACNQIVISLITAWFLPSLLLA